MSDGGDGAAAAAAAAAAGGNGDSDGAAIRVARRRLSVVSDNRLIEGVSTMGIDAEEQKMASGKAAAAGGGKGDSGAAPPPATDEEPAPPRSVVSCYAGFSKRGFAPYNPRKKNQDALVMAEDPATGSLLFVVLDGHGEAGDKVAQAFRHGLATAAFSHPLWATDVAAALQDCIEAVEAELLADHSVDTDFSGSTLVAACIRGSSITVANVGDSRAVLGIQQAPGGALVAEPLSVDHKPDAEAERERILAAGGRVFAVEYEDGLDGPPRVWLGHMDVPGLAMSRSLGDKVAHTAGVSSEPEFFTRELDPSAGDVLLILATDGLWEFMSNEECIGMAAQSREPRIAVEALITEASERWMKEEQVIDDTTVCVAFLGGWSGGAP